MRTAYWVIVLATVAGCTGEKPAPGATVVDSVQPASTPDSLRSPRSDTTPLKADTVMVRDTARTE